MKLLLLATFLSIQLFTNQSIAETGEGQNVGSGGCRVYITSATGLVRPRRGQQVDMKPAYASKLAELGHVLTQNRNEADYVIDMDVKYSPNDGILFFKGNGERQYSDINLLDKNGAEIDSVIFDSVHWSAGNAAKGYKNGMMMLGTKAIYKAKVDSIPYFMSEKVCN